jgi:hypothetical protein
MMGWARWLSTAALLVALMLGSVMSAAAQQGPGTDSSFSHRILSSLGLPEVTLKQSPDGAITGAPGELAAGRYLVSLTSDGDVASYVNFVQLPAGVSEEDATAQVLETAAQDVPHEGYVYAGGSYALPNETTWFVVDLAPGDWRLATSYQAGEGGQEIMRLLPLTVTGPSATPAASPVAAQEIPTSVRVELRDTSFQGPGPEVLAGPQLWEITNTGEQPRQVVFWRTPQLVSVEQFQQLMTGMMSGTPVPGAPTFDQFTWVAYAAILSPGKSVWLEPDLSPGSYLLVSYVLDPKTGQPAFALGMVQPFTVVGDIGTPIA